MHYLSPWHIRDVNTPPFDEWSIEDMVDVFFARTDGWQLEIADRVINGWDLNSEPCINAVDRQGRDVHYIPDSAWAVVQIVLSYFETVGFFKGGPNKYRSFHYNYFRDGVYDIFPDFIDHPHNIARKIYSDARGTLYHTGISKQGIVLRHRIDSVPIAYEEASRRLIIDPHLLVPHLRRHLQSYCDALKDTGNEDLRNNFTASFVARIRA